MYLTIDQLHVLCDVCSGDALLCVPNDILYIMQQHFLNSCRPLVAVQSWVQDLFAIMMM